MNEVKFVEQDAYYDDSIYNMLSQFNEEASNLYLSLNYLLKEKPICYPRLVAHCIREIICIFNISCFCLSSFCICNHFIITII